MFKWIFLLAALAAFYFMIVKVGDKQAALALTACAAVFILVTVGLLQDA